MKMKMMMKRTKKKKKEEEKKFRAVYMLDSDKSHSQPKRDHCKTAMQRNPRMAGK